MLALPAACLACVPAYGSRAEEEGARGRKEGGREGGEPRVSTEEEEQQRQGFCLSFPRREPASVARLGVP